MNSAASAGARLTSPSTVWLMEVLPSSVPAVKSATVVSVNAAGVEPAPVVNENATSAAKALPARSLTRGSNTPPWTIARYGAWADRPRAGVRVAAWLPASYAMAATTGRLNASLSSNVVPATVDGSSASLNVTTIGAAASTFEAPSAGTAETTTGEVVPPTGVPSAMTFNSFDGALVSPVLSYAATTK